MSLQILGKAYAVLSDEEQRALYDEQGTVDEEGEALREEWDWQEYWRLLFKKVRAGPGSAKGLASAGANPTGRGGLPLRARRRVSLTSFVYSAGGGGGYAVFEIRLADKSCNSRGVTCLLQITVKDIEDFEKNYKGSEEEVADVKAAYMDFEGDMDSIMQSVLCADYTDEPRIRKIIEKAIESGEVPRYKSFVKESKQKMTARKRRVGSINQRPQKALFMISF